VLECENRREEEEEMKGGKSRSGGRGDRRLRSGIGSVVVCVGKCLDSYTMQ
jgi:hypothetical protein